MGNESSQADKTGEVYQRDGKLIGPAMSPTPSLGQRSDSGRVIGPSMSPLPSDGETSRQIHTSPKSSKKKKKRQRKGIDAITSPESGAADIGAIPGDEGDVVHGSTKNTKKKTKVQKVGGELEGDEMVLEVTPSEAQSRVVGETPQSKRKSRKLAKLDAAHDEDIPDHSGLQEQELAQSEPHPEPEVMQSPQSSKKKRPRNKKRSDLRSPQAPHPVSHAMGGSPPSAQQPVVNGLLDYESDLVVDAEEEVIPSSIPHDQRRGSTGFQPSGSPPEQSRTERLANDEDDREEEPSHAQFAGTAVPGGDLDQDDLNQEDSQWLHKRDIRFDSDEEPITDTRTSQEREDDAALPDLQPSQVKSEPAHPDSEAESESPSAARLERLERSRSRSMSRASASRLADEDLGLSARSSSPKFTSGPSSTGSNVSIPARVEDYEARPGSRDSTRSRSSWSSRNHAQPNGGVMDIDQNVDQPVTGSPPRKPTKHTKMARKKTANPKIYEMDIDNNAEEPDQNGGADGVNPEVEEATQQDGPQVPLGGAYGQETVSQPKKAKKRRLQPKMSVSLSQLEGNDVDGEGENQSRLPSFSQNSKLKDVMRGGSNEPAESEAGEELLSTGRNPAILQTQSRLPEKDKKADDAPLPKPKKAKRKRRNDASEDELETLMARNASKSLGLSDDENIRSAKRKRLTNGQKADGRWTAEELQALDDVVHGFEVAHGMTQSEINAMIHMRPDRANAMHQEFWNKADMAVPRRTRKQIVERARRLYHNFAGRGQWSEEQKQELHELFEKHGKRFAEISAMINRDQKDIRDYWRNQYLVHETQIKARWSQEETDRLKEVVEEALNKIRIMREDNDQFRPRPRTNGFDDEALLDWEQISAAMNLTRSRQQCKWKWTDLKEKGVAGDDTCLLPKQPSQKSSNGTSEELANAREGCRKMSTEEKLQLIEAIHDCGASEDGHIRWNNLVNERFRTKWHRPILKLVWYRLRQAVPDYDQQGVQSNARFLLNYYNTQQSLPEVGDHRADEKVEEMVISRKPGSRIWKKLSDKPRAARERLRRSNSMASCASSRGGRLVSSQILRIAGSDDENNDADRTSGLRSDSVDLGLDGDEERGRRSTGKKRGAPRSSRKHRDDIVPIRIPSHLKGEAAKKALEEARRRAYRTKEAKKGARSASVAVESDSE
ncbi:hypothetical protein VMCG_03944 [Cytospora schulzeri]|uniref:Myb-like domain-containing protein n=1 Tax=Cytospora schulzeri TaxID=448051 RepID=A0A423WVB7_9PEZI|nr:hypothetical protein VMCG_03944 [Valsa malicola]